MYFKIYALYFSPFGMLETQQLTKPAKQPFAAIGKRTRKRANGNAPLPSAVCKHTDTKKGAF